LTFYYHSLYKFTGVTEHSQNDVQSVGCGGGRVLPPIVGG